MQRRDERREGAEGLLLFRSFASLRDRLKMMQRCDILYTMRATYRCKGFHRPWLDDGFFGLCSRRPHGYGLLSQLNEYNGAGPFFFCLQFAFTENTCYHFGSSWVGTSAKVSTSWQDGQAAWPRSSKPSTAIRAAMLMGGFLTGALRSAATEAPTPALVFPMPACGKGSLKNGSKVKRRNAKPRLPLPLPLSPHK